MKHYKKFLNYRGYRGTDRISEFEGVVSSISWDLMGNIKITLDAGPEAGGVSIDVSRFKKGEKVLTMNTIPDDVIERGFSYLGKNVRKENDPDKKEGVMIGFVVYASGGIDAKIEYRGEGEDNVHSTISTIPLTAVVVTKGKCGVKVPDFIGKTPEAKGKRGSVSEKPLHMDIF